MKKILLHISVIIFVLILIAYVLVKTVEFLNVDWCLDDGGRWNYVVHNCEFTPTPEYIKNNETENINQATNTETKIQAQDVSLKDTLKISDIQNKTSQPLWLSALILKEKMQKKSNPPSIIKKCVYKDKSVYILSGKCCDIPSQLLDQEGTKICSPSGGITGKGDGKCLDFSEKSSNCEVVWEDER